MRTVATAFLLLGGCAQAETPAGPPSIVLISMDTLRADHLGVYGDARGLTPNIDRFASEGVVFEHAYSQATNTPLSHMSVFTSRYPSETQFGKDPNHAPMPTLAQVLGVYDYQTGAFVGGGGMRPEMGLDRGFGTYQSSVDFGSLWHTGPVALQWLDGVDRQKPFFAFVHGYDAHTPYIKPAPYGLAHIDGELAGPIRNAIASSTERIVDGRMYADTSELEHMFQTELRPRSPASREKLLALARSRGLEPAEVPEADLDKVRGAYAGGVAYGDAMFGLLLAGLEARGLYDDSVIVLMADHGEQLGEDGVFNHCCGTGDEETHVPLIVRLPHGEHGGRRVSGIVELIDVMPTILELAGAAPPAGLKGTSLVPALRGEPFAGKPVAYTQAGLRLVAFSARSLTGHLSWWGVGAETPLVADVVEAARLDGPGFVRDPKTSDEEAEKLRTGMVGWLRGIEYITHGQPSVSAALKESLKQHGYFGMEDRK